MVDRALIERAQHCDRDAYEALARSSARRLYATAYRITRDPDRADDAVQQTLVAIWRELPSLESPTNSRPGPTGWSSEPVSPNDDGTSGAAFG